MNPRPQEDPKQFREPSFLSQCATLLLAFIGGGVAGHALASVFASGSRLADGSSWLMLPLSFIIGMQLWLGFAIASAILSLIRRLVIHRKLVKRTSQGPPGGAFVFIPVAVLLSSAVGIIVSIVTPDGKLLLIWPAYALTRMAYGTGLWQAARKGYLPFPDEG